MTATTPSLADLKRAKEDYQRAIKPWMDRLVFITSLKPIVMMFNLDTGEWSCESGKEWPIEIAIKKEIKAIEDQILGPYLQKP